MIEVAFHVWDSAGKDSEEEMHQIVFADTSEKAKRKSEAYQMSNDYASLKIDRFPAFDQYREHKKVPLQKMIEQGWLVECELCYSLTDNSGLVIAEEIYCEDCQSNIYIENDKVYLKEETGC